MAEPNSDIADGTVGAWFSPYTRVIGGNRSTWFIHRTSSQHLSPRPRAARARFFKPRCGGEGCRVIPTGRTLVLAID